MTLPWLASTETFGYDTVQYRYRTVITAYRRTVVRGFHYTLVFGMPCPRSALKTVDLLRQTEGGGQVTLPKETDRGAKGR